MAKMVLNTGIRISFAVSSTVETPNNGFQWNDFVPANNPYNPFGSVNCNNTIGLCDIHAGRLKKVQGYVERTIERYDLPTCVEASTDRRALLPGAPPRPTTSTGSP